MKKETKLTKKKKKFSSIKLKKNSKSAFSILTDEMMKMNLEMEIINKKKKNGHYMIMFKWEKKI